MPIGPLVPGTPTTVTPDASPSIYTSTQGPAPDGPVVADDILVVHQIALNIQQRILPYVPGARASTMIYAPDECAWPMNGVTGVLADWARTVVVGRPPYWYQLLATDAELAIPISHILPPSGKIDMVTMNIKPNTGHGGGLPLHAPYISLRSSLYYDHTTTIVGSNDDDTIGAFYESSHDVSAYFTPETIDPSRKYWITLSGEYGTNSFGGLIINSVRFRVLP